MIQFKDGVSIRGIRPELVLAITVAEQVVGQVCDGQNATVTSVVDGTHSITSLHYIGHAFDLRTRDMDAAQSDAVVETLGMILAPLGDFDVVLEDDHIHVEWQPKGPM